MKKTYQIEVTNENYRFVLTKLYNIGFRCKSFGVNLELNEAIPYCAGWPWFSIHPSIQRISLNYRSSPRHFTINNVDEFIESYLNGTDLIKIKTYTPGM